MYTEDIKDTYTNLLHPYFTFLLRKAPVFPAATITYSTSLTKCCKLNFTQSWDRYSITFSFTCLNLRPAWFQMFTQISYVGKSTVEKKKTPWRSKAAILGSPQIACKNRVSKYKKGKCASERIPQHTGPWNKFTVLKSRKMYCTESCKHQWKTHAVHI